ncbi:hypothetical protein [Azospirillum endophyticum]|uniref:hypothetical protein n=1 Tax=Azospirillum endophyticum TaxID=2800326 RepID=UPI003CE509B9
MVYDSTSTDAEYPSRVGWVHSTWQECLRLAEVAGVGRAVIFHHDPARTDDAPDATAAEAEAMRPGSLVTWKGMKLSLQNRNASAPVEHATIRSTDQKRLCVFNAPQVALSHWPLVTFLVLDRCATPPRLGRAGVV